MFYSKEVVDLLKDLISIHSPYFKEDNMLEYVYNWFKEKKSQLSIIIIMTQR